MARSTVADVLADGLARSGAARVFAAPGAAAALRAAAQRRALEVVDAPDATSAAVLAAVSGGLGDAPGAAFAALADAAGLVRGLALAQRSRAPLIIVTGSGADAALLAPVVKASLTIEPASAGHWIAHAANLALTDPRGPVHLACAEADADRAALPVATACRPAPLPPPTPESLDALGAALAAATRPLVVAGLECGGDDAKWLRPFAETLPAPVLATPGGKGALADPHPLALGVLAADHPLLARADLVLLAGVDDAELSPGVLPGGVPVARIGRAPWAGGWLVAQARGDLALVIEELAPHVRARQAADWDVAELDRVKRAVVRAGRGAPGGALVALAREATPADTIATSDGPSLAAWQAVAPREALVASPPAPAGYAVLAAVAAQLAQPERRVVAFTTAEGFERARAAWGLAVERALPVIVVVMERSAEADEAAFATNFARAFLARRPAVVGRGS